MMDKKRGRKNTPECHLREGQTALAAALGALDDPEICLEDRSLDPALLVQALDHYRQAEAGFAAAVLPNLEAQALLGQAEVLLRMSMNAPSSREHLTHAEQSARKALERLDSVQDLAHALRGYLLLAETSRYLAMGGPPFEQEAGLRQLQALLDSTEYLAQEYGDPLLMARASAEACRVMSERFEMERLYCTRPDRYPIGAMKPMRRTLCRTPT